MMFKYDNENVQCCPSPYHILPDALGIDILSNKGDASWVIAEINNGNKETELKRPYSNLAHWIHGRIMSRNDYEALKAIMESIANVEVTLTKADDGDNYYLFLPEHCITGQERLDLIVAWTPVIKHE